MVMDCWCATSERLSERTRWERELERKCAMPKSDMLTVRRTCVSECERRQRVFFLCRTIRRTFIYILPSLLFCLPSFLSYIAIIYKKLHKKDICSGMFKWSTKYLCSCLIICRECCVWCVFSLLLNSCERDVTLSVGGALGVDGEWGRAWALNGFTGMIDWWKLRMLQEEVAFVMCFECFFMFCESKGTQIIK